MSNPNGGSGASSSSGAQSSPNATVQTVHHSRPQGAILVRPMQTRAPKLLRAKPAQKLHQPVRKVAK